VSPFIAKVEADGLAGGEEGDLVDFERRFRVAQGIAGLDARISSVLAMKPISLVGDDIVRVGVEDELLGGRVVRVGPGGLVADVGEGVWRRPDRCPPCSGAGSAAGG